jgi:PIN domain nuclease of toxin-antitoxin system
VRLSAASVWEIAVKSSIGKLSLPPDADIAGELAEDGFLPLPILFAHAEAVRRLPHLHRDPFDRMLAVQSKAEGLALVTADPELAAYGIELIDATE